ncbi:uncharacterized protein LOC117892393 [Drosophila subobscura]|uniref:uncharacterized protein LOC117892393 n=1 Tax=Drosophila subobscura TaxID=7241 RepID=UPI00155A28FC|nr:uncharacterized protein LOC117892393 [Drosophila subobscura]XP_034654511.1 uncharacterized protein LOC117892393 [Drosophila subobscura]
MEATMPQPQPTEVFQSQLPPEFQQVQRELPFDQRNWLAIVHGQQSAERAVDAQLLGHETQQQYRRRVRERNRRRQQLRETLADAMPWSDAHFLTTNVHSEEPNECNSDADWQQMLQLNLGATVRVTVGPATFWCIGALLRRHSSYFRRQPMLETYSLPELTPLGFRAAYDWMRLQQPLDSSSQIAKHNEPERIVDLLYTAQHLNMFELEMLCHRRLGSNDFQERRALQVYSRAQKYASSAMGNLCQSMLQHVGKYFLTLVGSLEYARMPLEDVCVLLQQDNIGVNTELEVLYAALRWMCIFPQQRISALPRLMECVRFTRMPRGRIMEIWFCLLRPRRRLPHGLHLLSDPIIFRAVAYCPGLFERAERAFDVTNQWPQLENRLMPSSLDLRLENVREWLYDECCPYHIQTPNSHNRMNASSKDFINYAISLAHKDRELLHAQEQEMTKLWEPLWDPQRDWPNARPEVPVHFGPPPRAADTTTFSAAADCLRDLLEEVCDASDSSDTDDTDAAAFTFDTDSTDSTFDTYESDDSSIFNRRLMDNQYLSPDHSMLLSGYSSPTNYARSWQATSAWVRDVQALQQSSLRSGGATKRIGGSAVRVYGKQ